MAFHGKCSCHARWVPSAGWHAAFMEATRGRNAFGSHADRGQPARTFALECAYLTINTAA